MRCDDHTNLRSHQRCDRSHRRFSVTITPNGRHFYSYATVPCPLLVAQTLRARILGNEFFLENGYRLNEWTVQELVVCVRVHTVLEANKDNKGTLHVLHTI